MLNRNQCLNLAVNDHNHKESAEDREALGLNGNQGLKKERSGSNHDTETFQGQINVSFFRNFVFPFSSFCFVLLGTQSLSVVK